MRLLLVKLSSLGDIVHTLPALTDASRARSGLEVHWVIEEQYQAVAALHPAVTRVVPVAIRRWRRSFRGAGAEIAHCIRALRESSYELVLDAQGLIKSALVARVGRGRHVGFDADSARERVASLGYRCGITVAKRQHAIDRQRALFAAALEYALPTCAIDYGTRRNCADPAGLVFAHGTTWDNKRWPEHYWADLANRALREGKTVTLPWGNGQEHARAHRIAALAPGTEVAVRLDARGMIELLAKSAGVVSVDSGIGHLAVALGVPTVALFGPTDALLTGCRGESAVNLSSTFDCSPCLKRQCSYRGAAVCVDSIRIEPACFSQITPEIVWRRLRERIDRT